MKPDPFMKSLSNILSFRRSRHPRIFVSYRREDSSGHAGRLYDALCRSFDKENIFFDIDSLGPGVPFTDALDAAIASCDIFLAVIGRQWLGVNQDGKRRIDLPDDFTRREIAAAIGHGVRIIPVLVQGAAVPPKAQLPPDVADLVNRQAVQLNDYRWKSDVERLIKALEPGRPLPPPAPGPAPPQPSPVTPIIQPPGGDAGGPDGYISTPISGTLEFVRSYRTALASVAVAAAVLLVVALVFRGSARDPKPDPTPAQPTPSATPLATPGPTAAEAGARAEEGQELLNRDDLAGAETAFGEAARLDPGNSLWHLKLAIALSGRNKNDKAREEAGEAERLAREALARAPDNADNHYALGGALRLQEKYEESEAEAREAVRLDANKPDYHNSLGLTLRKRNNPGEAEKAYREAIRLKPDTPVYHRNLSGVLRILGKPIESKKEDAEFRRLKKARRQA